MDVKMYRGMDALAAMKADIELTCHAVQDNLMNIPKDGLRDFTDGIVWCTQFLVLYAKEEEYARQLLVESGESKQDLLISQQFSGHRNDIMIPFIESCFD